MGHIGLKTVNIKTNNAHNYATGMKIPNEKRINELIDGPYSDKKVTVFSHVKGNCVFTSKTLVQ